MTIHELAAEAGLRCETNRDAGALVYIFWKDLSDGAPGYTVATETGGAAARSFLRGVLAGRELERARLHNIWIGRPTEDREVRLTALTRALSRRA